MGFMDKAKKAAQDAAQQGKKLAEVLALYDEIGVLVGLALGGLDVLAGRLHSARRRNHRAVREVSVGLDGAVREDALLEGGRGVAELGLVGA